MAGGSERVWDSVACFLCTRFKCVSSLLDYKRSESRGRVSLTHSGPAMPSSYVARSGCSVNLWFINAGMNRRMNKTQQVRVKEQCHLPKILSFLKRKRLTTFANCPLYASYCGRRFTWLVSLIVTTTTRGTTSYFRTYGRSWGSGSLRQLPQIL